MAIEPGQVIGDYEVLSQIGAGGMGSVYKVRNLISERIDAMKVLRPLGENTADATNRFLREIKLQASLKHPNIAVLYTAMRFEDQMLMFMELLEGIGLDQRLRRGWLPPDEAVRYASQCLLALEYAHQRGVVHRDIKPSNLMLTPTGVKLLDFGIARSTKDLTLTGQGTAVGTVHYMSPEQALGKEVDARSDLYSTGVMLYEMLVGARPFSGDNAFSVLRAHIEQEPLSPADLNPALPDALCHAVLKAMRKRAEDRFQSAAAFRAEIEGKGPASTETIAPAYLVNTEAPPLAHPRSEPPHADHAASAHSGSTPSGSTIDTPTATRLAALLANEIGPIASHVVRQACSQTTDLREACEKAAAQVSDETGRRRFLDKCERELHIGHLGVKTSPSGTSPSATGSAAGSAARPHVWDAQTLDPVKKALAGHVGPMARILVDRASKKCSSLDELYAVLANEIEDAGDRAKFMSTRPLL